MHSASYLLRSEVWVYPGVAAWRFITIPEKEGREIKEKYGKFAKGWRSLPVSVTIGDTTWDTSLFPDKRSGSYLLPLKAKVRKAEGIVDNTVVSYRLRMR